MTELEATVQDLIKKTMIDERERAARIASAASDRDCDYRGAMDPETGEVPCAAEARGEMCVCAELNDMAMRIAKSIRGGIC